jgi:hypothetical protein
MKTVKNVDLIVIYNMKQVTNWQEEKMQVFIFIYSSKQVTNWQRKKFID